MINVRRNLAVPATAAWEALIDVRVWPLWGPSVTGATLDDGAVRLSEGATGRVRTVAGVSLPFAVTEWVPGSRWAWRVAGVRATAHGVQDAGDSACVAWIGVPVWAPAYVPLCWVALGRLGRAAGRPSGGS